MLERRARFYHHQPGDHHPVPLGSGHEPGVPRSQLVDAMAARLCSAGMRSRPASPSSLGPDPRDAPHTGTEGRLLERARRGSRAAVSALYARHAQWLRRWARGRLPHFARGVIDTSDLVQDALHQTFVRLARFEPRHAFAFRAYLRRAVENRIRDELRRAVRRPGTVALDEAVQPAGHEASQLQRLIDDETWARYLDGLNRLTARERRLIVGRAEFGYSYKKLAFIEGQPSPDAARMALRRALIRLSEVMPDA